MRQMEVKRKVSRRLIVEEAPGACEVIVEIVPYGI